MSGTKQRREPWRNPERHYCSLCNAWMGHDRQSILLHENGKKHQEKLVEASNKRRDAKLASEKTAQLLQSSLRQMEQSALQSFQSHDAMNYTGATAPQYFAAPLPPIVPQSGFHNQQQKHSLPAIPTVGSSIPSVPPSSAVPSKVTSTNKGPINKKVAHEELLQWEARKKQRRLRDEAEGDGGDDAIPVSERKSTPLARHISLNEGYYSYEDAAGGSAIKSEQENTGAMAAPVASGTDHRESSNSSPQIYLECSVFGEILEEELPVQIWLGAPSASMAEKRLTSSRRHWRDGIVVAIRKRPKAPPPADSSTDAITTESSAVGAGDKVVDVSFLQQLTDEDETIEKGVPLDRLRILLGSKADARIPETLEEARILATGGVLVVEKGGVSGDLVDGDGDTNTTIDEATGLSGWSTVSVKQTALRLELKEERERAKRQRVEKARQAEAMVKQVEARKMEDAKVANADDSALGAYDVWSRGEIEGYKGVKIHEDHASSIPVSELAKKLATGAGGPIGFRAVNKSFANAKSKKHNRRTTTADDDD
jgi:U1 zinc finger